MEEQLFDLLEQKSFSELTPEEKNFVLEFMTEQEYQCQRKIMTVAPELKAEKHLARPLVLPSQKRSFWLKSIPMYQVGVGAAAACFLFVFLLFQEKEGAGGKAVQTAIKNPDTSHSNEGKTVKIVEYDTIYKWNTKVVEKIQYVLDTIYIYQDKSNFEVNSRTLVAQENRYIQDLNPRIFEAQNSSLKQDCTSRFIPKTIVLRN